MISISKKNGTVEINMKDYLLEAFETFGKDVSTNVASFATKNFFTVKENSKPLDKERSEKFYSVVAKLFWAMKRGRPYL